MERAISKRAERKWTDVYSASVWAIFAVIAGTQSLRALLKDHRPVVSSQNHIEYLQDDTASRKPAEQARVPLKARPSIDPMNPPIVVLARL